MVEIIAYAIGIMYSPGPANLLSLNAGLHRQVTPCLRFCLGVASAMLLLFLLFGYTGAWLMPADSRLIISAAGSLYIGYLAWRLGVAGWRGRATVDEESAVPLLGFKTGLLMQLLNPKAFVAILPIVTVQFPAANIDGANIGLWSLLLAGLAFGAPACYLFLGARLGSWVQRPLYFRLLNGGMSLLLLHVAADIAYYHVYLGGTG